VNFENYKDSYQESIQKSIAFIGQKLEFFTEVKANQILKIAKEQLGNTKLLNVLDVGCGIGLTDKFLASKFNKLSGVDVFTGVINKAIQLNPLVNYQTYDGQKLPFEDGSFDIVFTICVIQCVPKAQWQNFIEEMKRVVKKGGLIIIFEHNPYNPLTRFVTWRCELNKGLPLIPKNSLRKLFKKSGLKEIKDKYIVFFPWRSKIYRKLENLFGWFPIGAQYLLVGQK